MFTLSAYLQAFKVSYSQELHAFLNLLMVSLARFLMPSASVAIFRYVPPEPMPSGMENTGAVSGISPRG